jgi:hypothetical protein
VSCENIGEFKNNKAEKNWSINNLLSVYQESHLGTKARLRNKRISPNATLDQSRCSSVSDKKMGTREARKESKII